MSENFYRAFEEKLRGSRELIKSRLLVYLSYTQPLLSIYPDAQALDLGCGRGEWLELMAAQGFQAKGIDLDEGMLKACRERGLNVETSDVIDYLESVPRASLCVVSGFHIAEHLPFNKLQQLIEHAKRALVPGGLLILETPNPENITVGTCNFYLDPTHHRPIPPLLLDFLPEHYGFTRTKIIRLQEDPSLHLLDQTRLIHVLGGVSPDYSVIAQNPADMTVLGLFDDAFAIQHGITLENLAEKFQQDLDIRLARVEAKVQLAQAKAQQAQAKAHQASVQAQQSTLLAQQYGEQLKAVYSSSSWRITAAMRWSVNQLRQVRQVGAKARTVSIGKKILRKFIHLIVARPALKNWGIQLANRLGLGHLLKSYIQQTLYPKALHVQPSPTMQALKASGMALLSPYARKIHADLAAAVSLSKQKDI